MADLGYSDRTGAALARAWHAPRTAALHARIDAVLAHEGAAVTQYRERFKLYAAVAVWDDDQSVGVWERFDARTARQMARSFARQTAAPGEQTEKGNHDQDEHARGTAGVCGALSRPRSVRTAPE
jgi:hypothetical protein